ncbi:NeuB family protein [uncultured archaeon]|nr:NeuB family protein [uncultured archaeon]
MEKKFNKVDFNDLDGTYIIAEIGINHNGDLQIAKKLVDGAFATGWNCVKFQKRTPDLCVPECQKNVEKETPWGKMTYLEYKHRMEFGRKEYDYLDKYCREKPIDWAASVWDLESLEFMSKYELPFIKIPSAMLTNNELVTAACKTGRPILLSTGMSTLKEIDSAAALLKKHASQYALLVCNSSYPAKLDELNLRSIPVFKKRYNCAIGYSGHEYGLDPTTVAVALGAQIVERHITLDHTMWGTDQSSSVEIQGMDKLYKQIRSVPKILGNGVKTVYESEIKVRKKLRGY